MLKHVAVGDTSQIPNKRDKSKKIIVMTTVMKITMKKENKKNRYKKNE